MSNTRPNPIVVPIWATTTMALAAIDIMVNANTRPAAVTTDPLPPMARMIPVLIHSDRRQHGRPAIKRLHHQGHRLRPPTLRPTETHLSLSRMAASYLCSVSTTCHAGPGLFVPTTTGLNTPTVRSASAAVSKASATASRSSGNRWPYLSSVSTADLCPRSFCSTLTLAPSLMAKEAQVCLKSCSRTPSHPSTAAVAFWKVLNYPKYRNALRVLSATADEKGL